MSGWYFLKKLCKLHIFVKITKFGFTNFNKLHFSHNDYCPFVEKVFNMAYISIPFINFA